MDFIIGEVYINVQNEYFYKVTNILEGTIIFTYGSKLSEIDANHSAWKLYQHMPFTPLTKAQVLLYG